VVPGRVKRQSVPRSSLAAAARSPSIAMSEVARLPELRRRTAGCSFRGATFVGSLTRDSVVPVLPMAARTLASTSSMFPSGSVVFATQRKEIQP
jgi:hypothetical protein